MLTHGPRQAHVWLIFDVRQLNALRPMIFVIILVILAGLFFDAIKRFLDDLSSPPPDNIDSPPVYYTSTNIFSPPATPKRRSPQSEWWKNYSEYLASPEWAKLRARILARDAYRCRQCLLRGATDVHHLTYKRMGHELDEDLISVCGVCHQSLHSKKPLRRWGRQ